MATCICGTPQLLLFITSSSRLDPRSSETLVGHGRMQLSVRAHAALGSSGRVCLHAPFGDARGLSPEDAAEAECLARSIRRGEESLQKLPPAARERRCPPQTTPPKGKG